MSSEKATPAGRKTYRLMSIKAALGLLVIALCAAGNVFLLQAQVESQASDAVQINVSGRQRMLSQRLATQLLQIATATDPELVAAKRASLLETMTELGTANRALTQGDESRGMFFKPSEALNDHYWGQGTGLAPRVDALMGQAAMYTYKTPDLENSDFQDLIRDIQGPILKDLDHATKLYQLESVARVERLGKLQVQLTALLVLFLVLEFHLIFHPMAKTVGEEMDHVLTAERSAVEKERSLARVLDSTQDVLVPLDAEGRVLPGSSARAKALFPALTEGEPYWTAFGADGELCERLEVDFEQIQEGMLPFELLIDQMCDKLVWQSLTLALSLHQILEPGEPVGYLLTLRDVSAQIKAQAEFDLAQEHAEVLTRYGQNPRRFYRSIEELERLLSGVADASASRVERLRDLHTVKGSAAVLGFQRLSRGSEALERDLSMEPSLDLKGRAEELHQIWNAHVQEMLPGCDKFSIQVPEEALRSLSLALRERCPDIAPRVEAWLGVSVRAHLEELAAHGAELALQLGKDLEIEVECSAELHVPHGHSDRIWGQLVHLVRNAVDHGIEAPEAREAAGKARRGVLRLCASEGNGVLTLRIEDDGAGVDWAALRAKAKALGIQAETPEDLLFADGLSSRDEATDISGRGLGAGAFRQAVHEAMGTLRVASDAGIGTQVLLRWPHTPEALLDLAS